MSVSIDDYRRAYRYRLPYAVTARVIKATRSSAKLVHFAWPVIDSPVRPSWSSSVRPFRSTLVRPSWSTFPA